MKCVTTEEGKDILQEAHEGTCGNHVASRTLVRKVFKSGFYWTTALSDAEALLRRCIGCQYFAKQNHLPAYNLITIPPSWSFACWSLDMIGPLPIAPGGFTHILVAVDKFTKWIEVKPIMFGLKLYFTIVLGLLREFLNWCLLTLTNDHFQASTWSENHESLHFLHASLSNKVPKPHFTF